MQMQMFAPAHQLAAGRLGDLRRGTPEELFDQKRESNPELVYQLEDEGVKTPLEMFHGEGGSFLRNGTTRLAAAMGGNTPRLNPNSELPITNVDKSSGITRW
jgi:hypothetical protein